MKPLPLAVLILIAAGASWWLFASDEPPAPSDVDTALEDGKRDAPAPTPSSELPDPPAGGTSAKAPEKKVEAPAPEPKRAKPILPLADKFIENATWDDEEAILVLEHIAQAAGLRLKLGRAMQFRLGKIRVTMKRGRTAVPLVLDLILQPHIMTWKITRTELVVIDNDD